MIAIFYLVLQILKLYSYVVIANVLISWLIAFNVLNIQNRFVYSILELTYRLTDPFLNKIRSFLEDGNKAKVTLRFRGREMAHQNIGMQLLKRVEEDLEGMANVEQFPTLEGRQLVMMMAPSKK